MNSYLDYSSNYDTIILLRETDVNLFATKRPRFTHVRFPKQEPAIVKRGLFGRDKMKTVLLCQYCGKEFARSSKHPEKKFCSLSCAGMKRSKEKSNSWTGGRHIDHVSGYVRVYVAPYTRVLEHVLIIEQTINRKLHDDEVVHHINGIRNDNRIENLRLMKKSDHMKLHAETQKITRGKNGKFCK